MGQEKQLLSRSSTLHSPLHPAIEDDHHTDISRSSSGLMVRSDVAAGGSFSAMTPLPETAVPKLNTTDSLEERSGVRGRRHNGQARIAGLMTGLTLGFASLLSPAPLGPTRPGYLAGHRAQEKMSGWRTGGTMGLPRNEQPAEGGEGLGRGLDLWGSMGVDRGIPARSTINVQKCGSFLYTSVVFANDELLLEEEVKTDSYDSARGEYGGMNRGARGDVRVGRCAGDFPSIVLSRGCSIRGNLILGKSGMEENILRREDSVLVTGKIVEKGHQGELPLVLPPWGLRPLGEVNLSGGDVMTLARSGVCGSISLDGASRLIIDSDVYLHVRGSVTIRGKSRLMIAKAVTRAAILVEGDVVVESGSAIVNLTGLPSTLILAGTGRRSAMTLSSEEAFQGVIYMPQAEVHLGPEMEVFGALCAKRITVSRGGRLHFDEALGRVRPPMGDRVAVSRGER
jgi:hypothetical protein